MGLYRSLWSGLQQSVTWPNVLYRNLQSLTPPHLLVSLNDLKNGVALPSMATPCRHGSHSRPQAPPGDY
ncbi:hypothetical protein SPRG_15336 [Saprolegnia parasitica CBS 223.65]|uniref:Uncharacterized protein n=1 Tax=Saprolegnia parasitica (strain CBS 223.65) TaxID=695850 RepID=A0A067BYW6_SAPPC|nr:hypothetical protein SPRG_15336 [Saprolegnia parasitica CBS 223.65]KDO19521.1 hypothetical protein SPRG_15336 [Saprolegnia parasitica CBS 223.65]|eukprot:XP_012209785.1 hypothetical protein SPRG_15336 [Saprolegnia parasitica CBS 223.65]